MTLEWKLVAMTANGTSGVRKLLTIYSGAPLLERHWAYA